MILPRKDRRATALVIVLSFLVLLTGVIVAYLSRTISDRQLSDASFNTLKASELARSALNVIIGDFKQEITAGSTAATAGATTVYVPTSATGMLPARNAPMSGGTDVIPNLIRVSSASALPAPGLQHSASNSLSTAPSANGRSIPLRAWNLHYLIPRSPGAVLGDTTPLSAFVAPAWVYVTNQGPQVITAPAATTLGRYAYAVYDEGGLLDLNVAGYPSNADATQIGRKGVSSFADLQALGSASLTQAKIDHLVGWRNQATARPAGSFGAFTFDAAAAGRFVAFATLPTNNFLSINKTPWNNVTDQALLGRQQLIQLAHDLGPTDPLDWLQYVGTFSRERNAPTWKPAYDASERGSASGSYQYRTNAESSTQTNHDLATVRFAADCTLTAYALDGTPTTRSVKTGEPLVQQRFSLSRLAWLTPQGPSPSISNAAAAIKKHFGLAWDSANSRWNYTSPDGAVTTPVSTIKTLAQVSALNREADFMELLKASILDGSIGKTAGDPSDPTKDTSFRTADVDVNGDLQIIRIAANIIDQYDTDSWPTSIALGAEVAHGIENLPYVNRLFDTAYRPIDGGTRSKLGFWYEVEMWNPHQNPASAAGDGPSQFRVTGVSGQAYGTLVWGAAPTNTGNTVATPVKTFTPGSTYVQFALQPFAEATLLDATNSKCDMPPKNVASQDTLPLTGIFVGTADVTGIPEANYGSGGTLPNLPSYDLQYQDASGAWITYQHIANMITSIRGGGKDYFKTPNPNRGFYFRADPRNIRFGGGRGSGWPPGQTMRGVDTSTFAGQAEGKETADGAIAANPGWKLLRTTPAPTHARLPALLNNDANASTSYNDPDGVLRIADSGLRDAAGSASDTAGNCFTAGNTAPRPVVLNRPFRSVGELGYAFRDEPWKTLDLFSANSGDSGLLDVFSIDDNSVVAGKISLNTRQKPVLTALLSGAIRKETGATPLNATSAATIAQEIITYSSAHPFLNRGELVTGLSTTTRDANYPQFKTEREAAVRALTDVGSTRTWNLLIDVVAQAGKFPPGSSGLTNFVVEGEKRFWLHVAIDRFTGQVIDQSLEPVYD